MGYRPVWHLDVPQPDGSAPAPTIPVVFILAKDLVATKGVYPLAIPPCMSISIRNRMSRMLLFEFNATNGATLPVVVDPSETVTVNVGYFLVSGTCYDLTQFAVGQSPSSVHFQVPIGQQLSKREPDSLAYITPNASTDAQSSGGYALLVMSDQPMMMERFKVESLPRINATAYADTAISGLGTFTFDANQSSAGGGSPLPNEIAAGMWLGMHCWNQSQNNIQITYKPINASDTPITFYVPQLSILSLPLECFEISVTFTQTFQAILLLQNIVRTVISP